MKWWTRSTIWKVHASRMEAGSLIGSFCVGLNQSTNLEHVYWRCLRRGTKQNWINRCSSSVWKRPIHVLSLRAAPISWMHIFMEVSKHPVFELGLLPMTVVLFAWITLLQHCRCVFFLDNEAAKGSLIAGSTSSETGSWLVRTLSVHEMRCQL